MGYLIKLFVSAGIIVIVSELGKRISWLAALVASLPLISILSLFWLYVETKDVTKVINLSYGILFAVIPSLTLFIVLPIFLKYQINFYLSLILAIAIMFIGYLIYTYFMTSIGALK